MVTQRTANPSHPGPLIVVRRHRQKVVSETDRSRVIRFTEMQDAIPGLVGERSVLALKRGTLDIRLSLPVLPNQQTPHVQDEIYVVVRGRGTLVHGEKRDPFQSGDVLFVAAGIEHHYEDFTVDLAVWRVFYGRQGGEVPA